jgi:hypothetical protein
VRGDSTSTNITTNPDTAVTDETSSIISEVKAESAGRWTDVNEQDLGTVSKGHKWLETGRQYMQGERSLDLSFLRNEKDWDAVRRVMLFRTASNRNATDVDCVRVGSDRRRCG